MGKRRFGRVRRLPSGQYQARYAGPDGIDRPAPQTFTSKSDAEIWLTMKEAEIRRGDWADPEAGKVRFGDYAANWISDHVIKPRTEGLYRSQLRNHLAPTFGKKDLRDIHEADVRRWRKERFDAGPHAARPFGPVTVAKAYRLLHAIMNTAVEDGLIRRNPCRIKGAGQEYSRERPVVSVGALVKLIDEVPPRYLALLLLATFANLRFGELAGLRRDQLDLDKCLVRVAVSTAEMDDGRLIDAGPKSRAGPVRSRSRARSCRSCAGTWSASPKVRKTAAWSSLARWAAVFADPTSGGSGTRPGMRSASRSCIFTICGTPETRWRRPRAQACAS